MKNYCNIHCNIHCNIFINVTLKTAKLEYNLLLQQYDNHCNLFIDGKISLQMFLEIETEYLKRYQLFIINLN